MKNDEAKILIAMVLAAICFSISPWVGVGYCGIAGAVLNDERVVGFFAGIFVGFLLLGTSWAIG